MNPYANRSFLKPNLRWLIAALGFCLLLASASRCAADDLLGAGNPPATVHLARDTSMWLLFSADLNSQTATPGDVVPFVLAGDIKVGEKIVVKSGAPATAKIILVEKAVAPGRSGTVVIRLDYPFKAPKAPGRRRQTPARGHG